MGRRNVLVEGVSGAGKTSVCRELQRRGHHAINGDTELAYRGDPATGLPVAEGGHEHHLWDEVRVRALAADRSAPVTFFCGGSRNVLAFLDVFDVVLVLQVDLPTLRERLRRRDPEEWGGTAEQRALVERLHATGEDTPPGIAVDATRSLTEVVDEVLRLAGVGSTSARC